MEHPIIIIGSGMAGYTLAREIRKQNKEQALIMICADDAQNYAKPTLSNAYATKKQPNTIALADATKMATQLNIMINSHAIVVNIDSKNKIISYMQNGKKTDLKYHKLVLALGATPIVPEPLKNHPSVFSVNNLHDYIIFRSFIETKPEKRIVIVGGGLIGCEFAHDLKASGYDITILEKSTYPLSGLLPQHIAKLFQDKLSQLGISFLCDTTVKAINDHHITTQSNQQIPYDSILCAIGLKPNTELAQASGIKVNKGIIANTLLETNQPDIYALGDCVEVNELILPYVMPLMQQAKSLAKTLLGEPTHLHYPAMPVAIKTPTAPLTVLLPPQNITVTWHDEILEDGLIASAIDSENTLRGFILFGATAAKQRMSLTKLIPDLIAPQLTIKTS